MASQGQLFSGSQRIHKDWPGPNQPTEDIPFLLKLSTIFCRYLKRVSLLFAIYKYHYLFSFFSALWAWISMGRLYLHICKFCPCSNRQTHPCLTHSKFLSLAENYVSKLFFPFYINTVFLTRKK